MPNLEQALYKYWLLVHSSHCYVILLLSTSDIQKGINNKEINIYVPAFYLRNKTLEMQWKPMDTLPLSH